MRTASALFSCLLLVVQAQRPPVSTAGTGAIAGRVLDTVTAQPVKGAIVSLESRANNRKDGFLTGRDGTFEFRDVAAGSYDLVAGKRGYFFVRFGSRRPGGPSIAFAMADGQQLDDVTLYVCPEGSIAGRVTDRTGSPISNVPLEVYRQVIHGGLAAWERHFSSGNTGDDGNYQVDGLLAGEYRISAGFSYSTGAVVGATPGPRVIVDPSNRWALQIGTNTPLPAPAMDGSRRLYFTVFYPDATDGNGADTIRLAPGEHRPGINITLEPRTGHRVSGMVTATEGPIDRTGVGLFPGEWSPSESRTMMGAAVRPDGEFAFLQVPAGVYTLVARRNLGWDMYQQDPLGVFATQPVVVGDADVTNVNVSMRPGLAVRGHFVFAGTPPQAAGLRPGAFTVNMESTLSRSYMDGSGLPSGLFAATGTNEFVITGVQRGTFFARAFGPDGWTVESAMLGGRDASITPIDLTSDVTDLVVTMTNRSSVIAGKVTDDRGRPAADAVVLVFTPDPALWALGGQWSRVVQVLQPDAGRYKTFALPAGRYYVACVSDSALETYPSRELLSALAQTSALHTVAAGEQVVIDLVLGAKR